MGKQSTAVSELFTPENRAEAAHALAVTYGATVRHLCFQLILKLQEMGRFDEAEAVAEIALDGRNAIIK